MGLFSALFSPIANRVLSKKHAATATLRHAGASAGSFFSAGNAMHEVRSGLTSFEGKELFDSKQLAAHLKRYNKLAKHLLKYKAKKGICPQISHANEKYGDGKHPEVLEKVLVRETKIFGKYYEAFVESIAKVELDEEDLVLQKNATLIRDLDELIALIRKIPEVAQKKGVTLANNEVNSIVSRTKTIIRESAKEIKREFKERKKEIAGKTKVVPGWIGFIGNISGINSLGHKVLKLVKRVESKEQDVFTKRFNTLVEELKSEQISDATVARVIALEDDFPKLFRKFHTIDSDIVLIMSKLFKEATEVIEQCVIPFYRSIQGLRGAEREAKEILELSERLKKAHAKYLKECGKEEWELKRVHKELVAFLKVSKQSVGQLKASNARATQKIEQQMSLDPAHAHS